MKKIFLLMFLFTGYCLLGQSRFHTATSWDEIFSQARQENKMVIIDCYFEGCHPCKQMEEEVFPLPAVRQLMETAFIGIKTDCLKEDLGKAIQVKYGVTGFPTYLILNKDGQLVDYFSGYKEADKFTTLLTRAVASGHSDSVLNGFLPSLQVDYPPCYNAFFKERKPIAETELTTLFATENDKLSEKVVMPLLLARNLSQELEVFFLDNYKVIATRFGKGLADGQRRRIIDRLIAKSSSTLDQEWFGALLTRMKRYCGDAGWNDLELDIAEAYFFNHLKDHKSFFKFAINHTNNDDNKVRYMGMYMLRPGVDTAEVNLYLTWAKKILDQHSSQDALMYAAMLLLKRNNKQDAEKYAMWALERAKLNNRDASGPEKFLKDMDDE